MVGFYSKLFLAAQLGLATSAPLETRQFGASATSPPYYPAPKGGSSASWAEAYSKAYHLVSQMTLLEKVNVTTGTGWSMGLCVGNTGPVPRLNFPSLCLQDGPLGVRFADKITSWPAGITIGGTWDKELMYARGEAMGAEFRGKGVHVILGPVMGPLGRIPTGGRNWEGFGSDPYLQGIGAAESIKGIQSQGVIATAKHYIANEQEHLRSGAGALSANIDARTLHEIYLWPFQDSVKAGVGAVMCSYNRVNGSSACQNSWLQNAILKDELGFEGFIMSDWQAQYSGVASVLAGMDMTMPGDGLVWDDRLSLLGPELTRAVLNSSVPIDRLDDMVTRIVATYYQVNQDKDHRDPNFSSWTKENEGRIYEGSKQPPLGVVNQHIDVRGDHAILARKIAADAIALLKNEGVLPLNKPTKIGIYGEDAGPGKNGSNACADRGCNQGTLAVGWGSGSTDFEYLITPLEAIQARAANDGSIITSILDNTKLEDMKASAKEQDICLTFINADSGEGYITWNAMEGDRNDIETQLGGNEVIAAVSQNCKKTIVIVHSVGPIIMEKWAQSHRVQGILWAHLPGEESGNALVDVLYGDVNPSGKLPYTIGKTLADYGPTAGVMYTANAKPPYQDFTEGLYIDYRHFDKMDITPRYEFGFGMSYTTFEFSDLVTIRIGSMAPLPARRPAAEVEPPTYGPGLPNVSEVLFPKGFTKINRMIYPNLNATSDVVIGPYPYPEGYRPAHPLMPAGGGEGGNPALWEVVYEIYMTLENTGNVAGAEVAQLYIQFQNKNIDFPVRVLRGFEKVCLQPGEKKRVAFKLTRRDLSYWNSAIENWEIPSGGINIAIGQSSRKLCLRGNLMY